MRGGSFHSVSADGSCAIYAIDREFPQKALRCEVVINVDVMACILHNGLGCQILDHRFTKTTSSLAPIPSSIGGILYQVTSASSQTPDLVAKSNWLPPDELLAGMNISISPVKLNLRWHC